MRQIQKRNRIYQFTGAILGGFLLCLMIIHPAFASEYQVYDDAGILSESDIQNITQAADKAEQTTGWDLIVLTVDADSTAITSDCDYAEEAFNEYTESDDGVVYLLRVGSEGRSFYIATAGEAYQYIGDTQIDDMIDDAISFATDGNYAQAMITMLEDTQRYFTTDSSKDMTVYDEDQNIYYARSTNHRFLSYGEIAIAAVLGVAACLIFCVIITGKYRLKFGRYHYNAREHSEVNLRRKEDHFVRQFITRKKIPKDPPKNGGGGGTSTVHQGAGGRTFGGGGRSF